MCTQEHIQYGDKLHPKNHSTYGELGFEQVFIIKHVQTHSQCFVYVCEREAVAEAGPKVLGQTVESIGERTNCCTNVSLGAKVSEVPMRSEDTCATLPSSLLHVPIPPHLSTILFLPFFLFSPRSECSAVALVTLIPRSSLLTCPSACVFEMRRGKISLQQYEASEMHTHSDKLIDE